MLRKGAQWESSFHEKLFEIQDCTYQWEMTFDPYRTKQAKEVIFSRKKNTTTRPPLFLNKPGVSGLTLGNKLLFNKYYDKIHQAEKDIGLLQKMKQFYLVLAYQIVHSNSP